MSVVADQRTRALQIANQVRFSGAELREFLNGLGASEGALVAAGLLRANSPDVGHMQLHRFLVTVPKVGSVRMRRICRRADVWPLRKVRELTDGERGRVADLLERNQGWS